MSWFKKDPIGVAVQGRELKCVLCGHDAFWKREAQLNTTFATLLRLDWADKSGVCYVCARCGYIHWFLPQ